ncbi:MAG TPA: YggS family pyridoxal phosphate-dependent enzyme [Rhodanobacteraceae bacterium]|nr:YggS family pyridoxal phosphate-dependent enzyme [Rhodanobacteraceae bacterium]
MNREPVLGAILARIGAASGDRPVSLVAASKSQPASALQALAAAGQRAFGENYVQEALGKQLELAKLALEWHMIGPLQSNKCAEVARHFDWLQSLDREKLIAPLDRARPEGMPPLNVLIEVNLDDEASKSGCAPGAVFALAAKIARAPRLRLRGMMAIPAPSPDHEQRRAAFARLRELFEALRREYTQVDTLSMGMSDDFELAITEGATMVRVGTALFGPRGRKQAAGNGE